MTPEERTALLLRERLAGATAGLIAAPGVAERAATGGRARLKRRRIAEGAGTAIAAITAVLVVLIPFGADQRDRSEPAAPPDPSATRAADAPGRDADPYAWLYGRPPRGDLQGDSAYLSAVLKTWSRGNPKSKNAGSGIYLGRRGTPRVVWAGKTPAGKAALVVQPTTFPARPGQAVVNPGPGSIAGFVGVDDAGEPRIVDDDYWDGSQVYSNRRATIAWFVDPGQTAVVAIDLGTPLGSTQGWRYRDDGVRDHDWKALKFDDGAATFSVAGYNAWDAGVAQYPFSRASGEVEIAGSGADSRPRNRPLPFGDTSDPAQMTIKGLSVRDSPVSAYQVFTQALDARLNGSPYQQGYPTWTASGTLPDGTEVVVSDAQLDADVSHAYAVLVKDSKSQVVHAGEVDEYGPLPVMVKLPGGYGTVVVKPEAKLGWSSATSPWRDVGFGAAIVPPDATRVRVSLPGQEPQYVQLTR